MDLKLAGRNRKSSLQSWRNGGKKPTTMPRSTRIEPKDGMTRRSSPKTSKLETRY
jgi:hypothetical protein